MIPALFYLQYHSIKNRLATRLKRLKQPKYLLGAIVGALYFYFYFFRYVFHGYGQQRIASGGMLPENILFYESLGALVFFIIVVFAWVIPHERAALAFTEAEVAFLFPAPISRRGLIQFKLLRSQLAILFTIIFLTLVSNRFGGNKWIHAAGWWLILSTLNLHLLGSSFARTMLLQRGISNWQRRFAILGILTALAVVVIFWAGKTIPRLDMSEMDSFDAATSYAKQVLVSGPVPWLLYPFRFVVRPFLAPDATGFFLAAGPALLLMLLHYWWVIRSDVAFEEASVDASQKLAVKVAAIRAGNWRNAGRKIKKKRPPFKLGALGPQATALFWKNLISAGQMFTFRIWFILIVVVFSISLASGHHSGIVQTLGMVSVGLLFWSLLAGPQMMRQDLRQDLAHADVLKMYPMRGWKIVLGELLAPAAILTGLQWALLIFCVGFFANFPMRRAMNVAEVSYAIGLGAAVLLPMLNLVSLLIPNAGVLLFPAWFQHGKDAPQGIEATGQRLIMMLAQLLAFSIALIPAAIGFAIIFFVLKAPLGMAFAIPLGSLAAAIVLAGEAALGVMWLGWLFERFDLSVEAN